MAKEDLERLVGKVLMDQEFASKLLKDPEGAMSEFKLTDEEKDIIKSQITQRYAPPAITRVGEEVQVAPAVAVAVGVVASAVGAAVAVTRTRQAVAQRQQQQEEMARQAGANMVRRLPRRRRGESPPRP